MVKIEKTPLVTGMKINRAQDYRIEPLYSMIKKDFFNKCYLCGEKEPTSINVEHHKSQTNHPHLSLVWSNLFFSCVHCNTAKLANYDNIIDCTAVDPEPLMSLEMKPYPKEAVKVKALRQTAEVLQTVELLDKIYNGTNTVMKMSESENLRNRILKELQNFQQYLQEYYDSEETDEDLKSSFKRKIIKSISRRATFAAFKRELVRNNRTFNADFNAHLD